MGCDAQLVGRLYKQDVLYKPSKLGQSDLMGL